MRATTSRAVFGLRVLTALTLAATLLAVEAAPRKAEAAPIFGNVTQQFPLNDAGYDTAGGNDPNKNYFHTANGVQVRDAGGNLTGTILIPGGVNVYGLASDGIDLFASNENGSNIYRYLGSNLWTGGLGISESGARGLGVSSLDFYLITDDGANIARIDRATGATKDKYDVVAILGEGLGLDYIPLTNELIVTNGTDNLYRLKLKSDLSGIDSWDAVKATGLGANTLLGAGYNLSNGNLVLNDQEAVGKYAEGVIPEPATLTLLAVGGAFLLARRKGRQIRT